MMKLIQISLLLLAIATVASASGLRGKALPDSEDFADVEADFEDELEDEEERNLSARRYGYGTYNRNHGAYGPYVGGNWNNYYGHGWGYPQAGWKGEWTRHWNGGNYHNGHGGFRNGYYVKKGHFGH
mmetsp:Transcript_29831/g.63880  ORF Transcript_29831/g.63880 Transcript_29831/m.63880 type:complete len:127 (+) Transcript_29831:59-439(+)